jgi:hypothetical protein
MSNKNPFEIRLEVLDMARDLAMRSFDDGMNAYWTMINSYCENHNQTVNDLIKNYSQLQEIKPKMPTPQEIMEKANELYTFVTKKD